MSSVDSTPPARAGDVVAGKYQLVRRLGKGGMGTVWEAQHTKLQRRFAIKFLLPELAAQPDMRRRFEQEAKSAAAIESEHVVAVFDHGFTDSDEPFIVMEYLDGEDLARILEREQRLATFRAADLVLQATHGAAKAHRQGVVHRDIKPQNLFIVRRDDATELCKLLDFGVALNTATRTAISTKSGHLVGTLDYMSPEQLRGERDVDARSDIYSLGCVLYECLAGCRPYEARWPHELMHRILEAEATPLRDRRSDLPSGLGELVHRAIHKSAGQRFQSMDEFAVALAPFAARRTTAEARIASSTTVPSAPLSSLQNESTERPVELAGAISSPSKPGSELAARRASWSRPVLATLAALVFIALLVLVVRTKRSGEERLPKTSDVVAARPSTTVAGAARPNAEDRPGLVASEVVRATGSTDAPPARSSVASSPAPSSVASSPAPAQPVAHGKMRTLAAPPGSSQAARDRSGATESPDEAPAARSSRKAPDFDLKTNPYPE